MNYKGAGMKVVYFEKLLDNSKSGPGDDKHNDIEDAWKDTLYSFFLIRSQWKKNF